MVRQGYPLHHDDAGGHGRNRDEERGKDTANEHHDAASLVSPLAEPMRDGVRDLYRTSTVADEILQFP